MTTTTHAPVQTSSARTSRSWGRIACATAAAGTVPVFALGALSGDTGAEISTGLADDSVTLIICSIIAVAVSAGLFLSAARLGRAVGGDAGPLVTAAGAAVAMMYAAYYSVFGAGGIVASQMLTDPGPGLGEAASLLLNVMEIARYAPGLALVAAVAAAGSRLPRWVRVTAGVLVLMTLVPLTSWVAALLVPLWLGATAAVLRD